MKLIVAADSANGIGKNGGIPWHIPADMARFKALTMGATVIMGRLTWESLPAQFRPLPGRRNVILSRAIRRQSRISDGDIDTVPHWHWSLTDVAHLSNAWIIGGGQVYAEALALNPVDEIHLTRVHGDFDCDTFWPGVPEGWRRIAHEPHNGNWFVFAFETWVKP